MTSWCVIFYSLDSKFTVIPPETGILLADRPRSQYTGKGIYESLCRYKCKSQLTRDLAKLCVSIFSGDVNVDPNIARKLYCYHTSNGIAFYRLRPIKVEVAYNNPRIYIFHDVIYDGEIATIKHLATPKVIFSVTRHLSPTSNERSLY